jgi:hypothetical protein
MAGTTGLEPATSAVTGQRSNQLSYVPFKQATLRNTLTDPAPQLFDPELNSLPNLVFRSAAEPMRIQLFLAVAT